MMKKQLLTISLLTALTALSACAEAPQAVQSARPVTLPDDFHAEKKAEDFPYEIDVQSDGSGHLYGLPEWERSDYDVFIKSLTDRGWQYDEDFGDHENYDDMFRYYVYSEDECLALTHMDEETFWEGTDEEYTNPACNELSRYCTTSNAADKTPVVKDKLKKGGVLCAVDVTSDFMYEQTGLKLAFAMKKNAYFPCSAQKYIVGENGSALIGSHTEPMICDIDSDGAFEIVLTDTSGSGVVVPFVSVYAAQDGKPVKKYTCDVPLDAEYCDVLLHTDAFSVSENGKALDITGENGMTYRMTVRDGKASFEKITEKEVTT